MVHLFSLPSLLVASTLIVFQVSSLLAASPCVQFDVVQMAAADDISTPEFVAANPTEKLIRIRLPISSLVRLGSEGSLIQYLYIISGTTTSSFQVVDYAPKTTLTSDVDGSISIEESRGDSVNLGVKAQAPHDFPIRADASVALNASTSNSTRLQKLPPLHLLAASGTMHRGVSAYFKLKPSTQTTLEGDKTFEIVARVPYDWRAGLLYVTCAAYGRQRGISMSREDANLVCGNGGFVVGVYSAGDEVAKNSVRKLAVTQQQLEQLALKHAASIDDQRFPSIMHKIGAAFSIVKPRIPNRWLNQVLTTNDFHAFERHLPRKLRVATTEYREARKRVIGFAG